MEMAVFVKLRGLWYLCYLRRVAEGLYDWVLRRLHRPRPRAPHAADAAPPVPDAAAAPATDAAVPPDTDAAAPSRDGGVRVGQSEHPQEPRAADAAPPAPGAAAPPTPSAAVPPDTDVAAPSRDGGVRVGQEAHGPNSSAGGGPRNVNAPDAGTSTAHPSSSWARWVNALRKLVRSPPPPPPPRQKKNRPNARQRAIAKRYGPQGKKALLANASPSSAAAEPQGGEVGDASHASTAALNAPGEHFGFAAAAGANQIAVANGASVIAAAAQPRIPMYSCQSKMTKAGDYRCDDMSSVEEEDTEREVHRNYVQKVLAWRKGFTLCLICYLKGREKELIANNDKIRTHCRDIHQAGGHKCQKRGCLARGKTKHDIGFHEIQCRGCT